MDQSQAADTTSGTRPLGQQHTRTYQACIPCRRRKVRCDLGPVDNPHDPPCVRCRRESKECFFSATRRKRKTQEDDEAMDEGDLSDYEIRNARKRVRAVTDEFTPSPYQPNSFGSLAQQPLTPGGSTARLQPLRRPGTSGNNDSLVGRDDEDVQGNDEATAILQTTEVYSGHDALNLLYQAAQNGEQRPDHRRTASNASLQRPGAAVNNTPRTQEAVASPHDPVPQVPLRNPTFPPFPTAPRPIPGLVGALPTEEAAMQSALRAWSRFRFVRAGWFTAKEGILYIQYFYSSLAPLSPVTVPDYNNPATHSRMLEMEPMLTVTLLTISSRYMRLMGPGASSRPYAIHEKLWGYLQGMIDRLIWGQEHFGSGIIGSSSVPITGSQPASDINPLVRTGLRTLGTVEALLLLTEWHPRSLHFPPGTEGDELMIPECAAEPEVVVDEAPPPVFLNGTGGQKMDSWLEPCWRSDRLCWMLIGIAMSLAYELGVFDPNPSSDLYTIQDNPTVPPETIQVFFNRKRHIKELLQIYISQTSGRFGLTSMLPQLYADSSLQQPSEQRLQERKASLRRVHDLLGTLGTSPAPTRPGLPDPSNPSIGVNELILHFWISLAGIMELGNHKMFANRRMTRDLIKSGEYEELLKSFHPLLLDWKKEFDQCKRIPEHMRHIMNIEYEYTRVYLNSLGLQAVVERCTHNTPIQQYAQPAQTPQGNGDKKPINGSTNAEGNAIPLTTLMRWYGNDRQYIREVIEACRNVLKIVVSGLYPGEYLKHAPVRTYFRIISVAIILLKTFALGATEDDVALSLSLLDQAVQALRTCIVDDVHVSNRFADLADLLTHRIRGRIVRMSGSGAAGGSSTHSGNGVPSGFPPGVGPNAGTASPHPSNMPPPNLSHGSTGLGGRITAGTTPQWSGMGLSPSSPALSLSGRNQNSQTLWGITTESTDFEHSGINIMPPPSFGGAFGLDLGSGMPDIGTGNGFGGAGMNSAGSGDSASGTGGTANDENNVMGDFGLGGQDWLALPLDPILSSYGADVTQTTYGPDIGGYDMLDVLLRGG
ncbi:hypothetical protein P152DRAFT_411872, partial [Eremomyces bilateralis CBS 781.70]